MSFFKILWKTNHLAWSNEILHAKTALQDLFGTFFRIELCFFVWELCRFQKRQLTWKTLYYLGKKFRRLVWISGFSDQKSSNTGWKRIIVFHVASLGCYDRGYASQHRLEVSLKVLQSDGPPNPFRKLF